MRTYGHDVRHLRTLSAVIEDSIAIFAQDVSEYAFVGLMGGATACIAALILGLIGNPVSSALIPPVVIILAVLTHATIAQAFRAVTENLEPESARAFAGVTARAGLLLRPFVPLAAALAVAAGGIAVADSYVPSIIVRALDAIALAGAAIYLLPRSFVIIALIMQGGGANDALQGSSALIARAPTKVLLAAILCAAPSILFSLIGLATGFGFLATALLAFVVVGTMPFAAIVMSLLFFDAIARTSAAAPPPRTSTSSIMREAGLGGAVAGRSARRR